MLAIVYFHIQESTFYIDDYVLSGTNPMNIFFEAYCRWFAFSGFLIVALTFFLIGWNGLSARKLKTLLAVCFIGILTLIWVNEELGQIFLEWDIYAYLIVSLLLIAFLNSFPKVLFASGAISCLALALPRSFYSFPQWSGKWFYNPLFGDYLQEGGGSWPLIPWTGLPILFFALGQWLKKSAASLPYQEQFFRKEKLIWLVLALLAIPTIGGYYATPVGPGFSEFVFNRPPIILFGNLFWLILAIRVSLYRPCNEAIGKLKAFQILSRWHLSRNFFLFYLVHIFWVGVYTNFPQWFRDHPQMYWLVFLLTFPLTELSCEALTRGAQFLKERLGKTKTAAEG